MGQTEQNMFKAQMENCDLMSEKQEVSAEEWKRLLANPVSRIKTCK